MDVMERSRERRRKQIEGGFVQPNRPSSAEPPQNVQPVENTPRLMPTLPPNVQGRAFPACQTVAHLGLPGSIDGNTLLRTIYDTGIRDGQWRERCHIYSDQIKGLKRDLEHANKIIVAMRTKSTLDAACSPPTENG
ncbi:unnamed protein product [Gongylonema pulchrum]|uniref:Uncharacterized protein n=1 Tax=Gongylonema pulchrum TaxID=637853 RepID=A0A3P6RPY5_9BILA|nr:unnamed protein product [Gongylonema pulchrum]